MDLNIDITTNQLNNDFLKNTIKYLKEIEPNFNKINVNIDLKFNYHDNQNN